MLTRVSVGFNNPIGIDHHEPSNQVVLSVHYSSGRPYNFELVAPDGARTKFSEISGLTEEVKISCVRSGPNQGGFLVGELFTGTGAAGVIARISPDGGTIQNPWVRLPGERGLMRGSLFQDRYGVFGGDLIAVTTTGGVWRVNADGVAARLAQINTHLEGVTTVPDNPAKYGPWAGKILIGAENQDRIYTVSATGSVSYYAIGVAPEDIEIIPENENFYGVDYGGRTLWGAPASAFADMVGDLLIAQESPGILWHVRWDAASGKFQKKSLAQVRQWEHVAFSPAGLLTIPPVPETRDPCPPVPPQPGPVTTSLAYLGPRAVLCERTLRVSAQLTDAAGRPLSGRTLTFSAAGLSAAAATDAGGIARTVLEVGHVASPLPLLVSFAGAPDLLPSSVQADIEIQPADSALTYTGRSLLALGIVQEASARLTDALDGRPLQGRAVAFQVGSQAAQATTDANGLATTAITLPTSERPAEVVLSFAGDPCYRPSSARAPITAYLPTSFVIWGGNPTPPSIGQRVNFWGAQWSKQVAGGDYDAHADFKGYASLAGSLQICQPAARTTGSPPLDPSCWTSKPGQSGPPAPPLPDHIGVIVATSIAKDQSTIYGNVAAVVVVRVDPNPAYGAVPGKPGFGTIVGAVEDGAGLFPQPPALLATQTQPVTALPGEAFDVTTEIANPSSATAAGVTVDQRFDGVTPASATIDAGSIDAGARKPVATRVSATILGARSEGESSAAYAARLESADGRDLRSASTIEFRDAAGQSYPPILVASSSRLRLPRLAATLIGTTCLGPGSEVAYELGAINAGSADAASATGRLRFPDGTSAETVLGALPVGGTVKAPFQWKVPAMPPKGAAESPQEYETRLAAQDAQPLTAIAELTWKDALGNPYGAVEQPFANTLRVPIVTTVPKNPAPLLPGAKAALVYTTQNRGSGNAFAVQIRVTSPGGSVAACAPFSLRGSSEPTPVQVAATSPAIAAKKTGEKDADYLARLQSADGAPLEFRHALTWQDASAAVYGPVEGSIAGTQALPVLSLSLQGPATAMSGDAIGYTATVTNLGHADAGSVIVHFTLPDGSKRDVQIPTLAAGATGRAPAAYTIPGSQATGTIVGKASLTWRDAVPNAYGPLEASAS
ncbi:MAG TPA: CARDB domain-containing protein, partial [Thermoanaerobaculia bacterium]